MPKGSKSRYVPLTDGGMCATLRVGFIHEKSPFVFPGKTLSNPGRRSFVRWHFDQRYGEPESLAQAGIPYEAYGSHPAGYYRRESLRRAAALGHRDIKTTARYSHLTPGFIRRPWPKGSLFASPLENQAEVRTGSKTGSGLK